MLYAIRLGPMEDDEGALTFWYIGFVDAPAFRSVLAKRDEVGLRLLARRYGRGHALQCEPALAEAGKKLGFVSRPMPELIQRARGFIAFGRGLGPYGGRLLERDDLPLYQLLRGTALFMRDRPWRWWSGSQALKVSVMGSVGMHCDGSLMGFEGPEVGIILYDKTGAIDRVASAVKAGKIAVALKEDGMSVMVSSKPEWAIEPMQATYGFRGIPVPVKLHNGRIARIDPLSLTILSAALEAASMLRPDNLTGSVDCDIGDSRLRLTMLAPPSLM